VAHHDENHSQQKHVSFIGTDSFSKQISSQDLIGKRVVLYFYPKDNTPGCTIQAKDFSALISEFKAQNTIVIGVSKDSCESHQKFINAQALKIDLLSDPDLTLIKSFDVWKEKKNFSKTYFGVVRSTFLIDEKGTLIKEWKNVKSKGHAETVLSYIKSLK